MSNGPACEQLRLGSCRATEFSPMSCGKAVPKTCECLRQCLNLYCAGDAWDPHRQCVHPLGNPIDAPCFVRKDQAANAQLSDVPLELDDANWYNGGVVMHGNNYSADFELRPGRRGRLRGSPWIALPLGNCPNRCHSRGSCVKEEPQEKELRSKEPRASMQGQCWCRQGYSGESCEREDAKEACWFAPDCGGHGRCIGGFCHCDPGHWGLGCQRSTSYRPVEGSLTLPARTSLKIYVYDLPWQVAFPGEADDGITGRDGIYTAYEYFLKYLLQDKEVLTENPHEANLFFIPALTFFYAGNLGEPGGHLMNVLDYVRTRHPFYNRTGGKDHAMFLPGDRGACLLPDNLRDGFIKIAHFGMTTRGRSQEEGIWRKFTDNHDYGCLLPQRDVVAAPFVEFGAMRQHNSHVKIFEHLVAHNGEDAVPRTLLFFFAGGLRMGDEEYSGGSRQEVAKLLKARGHEHPDVLFVEGYVHNYEELFTKSKFCISPYGHGWGLRTGIAVLHGCIPVIIQDTVVQPYEDLLPYHEFAVRVPKQDIPNLIEILRSYSDADLARMRLALARYYQAFLWPRDLGGKAYEWTLQSLYKRVHNMWGALY